MKKKLLLFIGVLFAALPICVNAEGLTATANVSCEKSTLKPGETTKCSFNATADKDVDLAMDVILKGTNLTISEVSYVDGWRLNGSDSEAYDNNNHDYLADAVNPTAKKGDIKLVTFKVTADKKATSTKGSLLAKVTLVKAEDINSVAPGSEYSATASKTIDFTIPVVDNTLKSIQYLVNDEKVSVANFSKDKLVYEISLPKTITSTRIFAEPTAPLKQASVSGAGIPDGNGGKYLPLNYGLNVHNIVVKNDLGETKTYTLKITREDPRLLKSLKVNNKTIELKENVYTYNIKVDYKTKEADIVALLEDSDSSEFKKDLGSRKINKLEVGNNEIQVVTYPKDDEVSELTYKIIINRLDENGRDTTIKNTDTTKNPKTFGGEDLTFVSVAVILSVAGYILFRKKSSFPSA